MIPIKPMVLPFKSVNFCGFNFYACAHEGESYLFLWTFSEFYILSGKRFFIEKEQVDFRYLDKMIDALIRFNILPPIFREYETW
jgi:hypothetical protein